MLDPLESSRRKVARAKEHFLDLERKIIEFERLIPYERVIEPDPDRPDHEVHKFKLTQPLPATLSEIAGDLVHSLRSALDTAGYSVALASGCTDPRFAAFPFAGSAAQMANSLGRSKDLPEQIQSLLCGFQSYQGGDDLLWALNEMCNADKHRMLIPIGTGTFRASADVRGTGYFSMPNPHVWNRTKNEMEIITLGPGAQYTYNFSFNVFVAFGEIEAIDGQPVLRILKVLLRKVESILAAIEAEARRLRIFR